MVVGNAQFLSFILILFAAGSAPAATYHVAADGSDERTAAQANSQTTPWKTLERVSRHVFKPGDTLLLRSGDEFPGRLVLMQDTSLDWNSPLVVSRYGDRNLPRPKISGMDPIKGWVPSDRKPGAWEAQTAYGFAIAKFLVEGKAQPAARFPAEGWAPMRRPEADTAFVAEGIPAGDLTGAWIHIRSTPWNIDGRRIASIDASGRVVLASKALRTLNDGWGWFLSGNPGFITRRGHWAHDSATGRFWWMPSAGVDPNSVSTTVSVRDCGIYMPPGAREVTIMNLDFEGQSTAGICGQPGAKRIRVWSVRVRNTDQWGIKLYGTGHQVIGTKVEDAVTGGIMVLGPDALLEHDTVLRIGDPESFGPRVHAGECCGGRGIQVNGDRSILRRSRISWTGWSGVHFRGKRQVIEENHIDSALQVSNDGGGLYAFSLDWADSSGEGTKVRRNIVLDSKGDPSGSTFPRRGHGIYLDLALARMEMRGNFVSGCNYGVLYHGNREDRLVANALVGNDVHIKVFRDSLLSTDMAGNLVDSNLFVSRQGEIYHDIELLVPNPPAPLSFRGNVVCRDDLLQASCQRDGRVLWQLDRSAPVDKRLSVEMASAQKSIDWVAWPPEKVRLDRNTGDTLVLRMQDLKSSLPAVRLVYSAGQSVAKGETWLVEFAVQGGGFGGSVVPKILQSRSPFSQLAQGAEMDLSSDWNRYRSIVRIDRPDSSVRFDLLFQMEDSLVRITRPSWRRVVDHDGALKPLSTVVYATSKSAIPYDLGVGNWIDPEGRAISRDGVLEPFAFRVAFLNSPIAKTRVLGQPVYRLRRLSAGRIGVPSSHNGAKLRSVRIIAPSGRVMETHAIPDSLGSHLEIPVPSGAGVYFVESRYDSSQRFTLAIPQY